MPQHLGKGELGCSRKKEEFRFLRVCLFILGHYSQEVILNWVGHGSNWFYIEGGIKSTIIIGMVTWLIKSKKKSHYLKKSKLNKYNQ